METQNQEATVTNLNEWTTAREELNITQMDQMVADYRAKRVAYEAKKAESTEAYHVLEAAEALVLSSLQEAGKSKYYVDGVGTVSLVSKSSYQTPKTPEDKTKLFEYIGQKYGESALLNFLSIHSATLNSFANKELENEPTLTIPGLNTPTVTTELRFRKD